MNDEQARMLYLLDLKEHILASLNENEEKVLYREMVKIAHENQALTKGATPTFFFDGRWWPMMPQEPKKCHRTLHPDLYEKVTGLLNNGTFNDQMLKAGVETFVGNILSISGHVSDLERLLPPALLVKTNPKIYNIKDPMTDQQIEEIKEKNKDNYSYFKRLLIIQLLLAKAD